MNSLDLRYEAGDLKKKVINKHSEIMQQATIVRDQLVSTGDNLHEIVSELKEIVKLADANAEYYTKLSSIASEQLQLFKSIQDTVIMLDDVNARFPTYIGNCIECGQELFSNSAHREEEPGNYLCHECYEKITS